MNPALDNLPPDPPIVPISTCQNPSRGCNGIMDRVRVFEGSKRPEKRGAICQTCMTCHWTYFHTDPYNYDDARRLLRRYTYPGDPSGFPRNLRPPPPPPLPSSQAAEGRVVCTTETCKTQGGARTQANQNCIEYKCKKCCTRAAREATESGQARRGCKAHGQPEVTARTTTPVHSNMTITSSQAPSLIPPQALPSQAGIPPGTTNSVVISSQAPLNALPQAVHEHSATPSQAQQPRATVTNVAQPIHDQVVVHPAPAPFPMPPPNVNTSQAGSRSQALKQPLRGPWSDRHDAALAKTASVKSLKVQQHEIEEQKKRTVTLIIWHTNGQPPVRLERHIISYPHLRLSDYPDLMDELSLQSNARLDVWQGSEWVTMAPGGVIGVEKGQRCLIKLRPSLLRGLDDCPELDKELDRQQKRNPTTLGLKRLGENFVSPIRKTARVNDAATVRSSQASLASSQALLSSHAVSIPSDDKVVLSVKPATVTSAPGDSRPLPSISLVPVAGPVDTPSTNLLPGVPAASCINVCAPQADFVPDSKDVRSQKKQWPHDFYVYEIHDGIALINRLTKQRPGHRKLKVEEAFRQAFPGVKWASSTYYDNKKIWDAQDPAVRDLFIDQRDSDGATFRRFIEALLDPLLLPEPESDTPLPTVKKFRRRSHRKRVERSSSVDTVDSESPDMTSDGDWDMTSTSDGLSLNPDSAITSPSRGSVLSFQPVLSVDLNHLKGRILELEDILLEVATEPHESDFFRSSKATFRPGSSSNPRTGNVIWHSAYYGADGLKIISAALRNLFPEESSDSTVYSPLTWSAFIDEFLVPEALCLLIQEDQHISIEDAKKIMYEMPAECAEQSVIKQEPTERLLLSDSRKSPDVIDLTNSSPIRTIKQEPEDCRVPANDGQGQQKEPEVIDLTCDDSD